ncbi:M48 family metalloprotease [Paenibacillus harenae]|nr:M48 family metalloprotease [Paenibacillus harenae]
MFCFLLITTANLILCAFSVHVLFLSIKKKAEESKVPQALIGVIFSIAPTVILPFIISSSINKDSTFMIILTVVSSFFVGISWTKKWWVFIESLENDLENSTLTEYEEYDFPYTPLRSYLYNLCNRAGLTNVDLFLSSQESINGFARANHIKSNSITLTKGCLELPCSEIAAIVGHEIVHIKYKDNTYMAVMWRIVGGLFLSTLLIAYITLIQLVNNFWPITGEIISILTLPIVIIYGCSMFVFLTIDNRRYWYQIQEIRADRLACELPDIEHSAMLAFLRNEVVREEEWFKKLYWYKKIYYRYYELLEHPSAKHRFKLINNYKKWSLVDYGAHMVQVTKWFLSGKGWNGL